MITIKDLQMKWNSIPSYSSGFLLISDDHPLSFHIGYNNEQKCFIVLNTGIIEQLVSSKAITIRCIQTEDQSYALCFSLNYPTLEELFIKLCWDLMDSSRDDKCPVNKIVEQYKQWLRLLQQAASTAMPASVQKGLIGELLYLSEAIERFGEEIALTAWVGPEGSDQDFNFPEYWAEIKTTTIASNEVFVSSLQQLDRKDDGFLRVYFMDKTTSNGKQNISLTEAVDIIHNKLITHNLQDEFDCKLAKYGYLEKDFNIYNEVKYHVSEKRTYKICKAFPRLIRTNIPVGITATKYTIDLSAINVYMVTEE